MRMFHCLLVAVPLLLLTVPSVALLADEPPAASGKIKLFVLSGQSNMVGYGDSTLLPGELRSGNDRVLMFEGGTWQPLRPFKKISSRQKSKQDMKAYSFGPEISFGHALAEAWPGETIGIVKQAWSATGVLAWHPQWSAEKAALTRDAAKGPLFPVLTNRVKEACQAAPCEVCGFVWLQGGADMKIEETAVNYLENLRAVVDGVRKETGVADLPFVLGSYRPGDLPDDLSEYDPDDVPFVGNRPFAYYVLKAQYDAQQELAPAKMVPLRNLETHPNNPHYNTKGQLKLGQLLAEGYLSLVGGKAYTGKE